MNYKQIDKLDKTYIEGISKFFTDTNLNVLPRDPNYQNVKSLIQSNENDCIYTIEVKNIPLQINHFRNLQEGLKYLLGQRVVISPKEYLEEYHKFVSSFRVTLNSKQEVQMSKETMSSKSTEENERNPFINGNEQFLIGWKNHLQSIIEPDKMIVSDDVVDVSEMFSDLENFISEVTGSVG